MYIFVYLPQRIVQRGELANNSTIASIIIFIFQWKKKIFIENRGYPDRNLQHRKFCLGSKHNRVSTQIRSVIAANRLTSDTLLPTRVMTMCFVSNLIEFHFAFQPEVFFSNGHLLLTPCAYFCFVLDRKKINTSRSLTVCTGVRQTRIASRETFCNFSKFRANVERNSMRESG